MAEALGSGNRFDVRFAEHVAQRVREIQRQATRQGRGGAVISVLRQIIERLKHEPAHFGEPLYRWPALRLDVRHGAVPPLFVDCAIPQEKPLARIIGTFVGWDEQAEMPAGLRSLISARNQAGRSSCIVRLAMAHQRLPRPHPTLHE